VKEVVWEATALVRDRPGLEPCEHALPVGSGGRQARVWRPGPSQWRLKRWGRHGGGGRRAVLEVVRYG